MNGPLFLENERDASRIILCACLRLPSSHARVTWNVPAWWKTIYVFQLFEYFDKWCTHTKFCYKSVAFSDKYLCPCVNISYWEKTESPGLVWICDEVNSTCQSDRQNAQYAGSREWGQWWQSNSMMPMTNVSDVRSSREVSEDLSPALHSCIESTQVILVTLTYLMLCYVWIQIHPTWILWIQSESYGRDPISKGRS